MELRESCFKKEKIIEGTKTEMTKKKFSCDVCGKLVSSKQSLNEHLNIHNGMLPYICSHAGCDMRFRQSSALSSHLRVHKTINKYLQENIDSDFLKLTSILKNSNLLPENAFEQEFYFSKDSINLPPILNKEKIYK